MNSNKIEICPTLRCKKCRMCNKEEESCRIFGVPFGTPVMVNRKSPNFYKFSVLCRNLDKHLVAEAQNDPSTFREIVHPR